MGILSEKSKHFKSVLTSFSEKCLNGLIQYNLSSCSIYVSLLSDGKLTQKQCDKSFYTLYDVQKFSVCLNPNENLASTLTFTFTKALYSCLKLSLPLITRKSKLVIYQSTFDNSKLALFRSRLNSNFCSTVVYTFPQKSLFILQTTIS